MHGSPDVVKDISSGMSKKSLSAYLIGFGLSLLLTVLAFGAAYMGSHGDEMIKLRSYLSMGATKIDEMHIYIALAVLAVVQLYVQVICFLRLNMRTKEGLITSMSFIFTLFVVFILVGGTFWIMWNLNYNMMH